MTTSIGDTDIIFGDPRQPNSLALSHPKARWGEFGTKTTVLRKGHTQTKGSLPLPCDILFERDVPVKLRDGVQVYVDIYRPNDAHQACPALVAWSPYGKQGGRGNQVLDDFPFRMGVPQKKLSDLQKWEGPDPAYWVHHGYAVINADPRGVGKNPGNIYQFGSQEGRDGADVIDWIGEQPWCSGKVSLSGNSYLSISQWFIAAEQPKHLAAIAPWEGLTDLYREGLSYGGVHTTPALNFNLQLLQVNAGEQSWENTVAMALKHQHHGQYHDDKRAKVENITVPAYVTASWSNPIHTPGTFRGYLKLQTEKWLRIHETWEWPDYYDDANVEDLRRFFDHFLKGINNGWEKTPRVRAKILDTAKSTPMTGSELEATSFPLPRMKSVRLYLDASNESLCSEAPITKKHLAYECNDGEAFFTFTFQEETILCGPLVLSLAVSILGNNDADIFINVEKILTNGNVGRQLTVPFQNWFQSALIRFAHWMGLAPEAGALFYSGPKGQIRVSRRVLDREGEVPGFPVSRLEEYHPVNEGEIVAVQPMLTPIGMTFRKGEKLRLRVGGTDRSVFPPVDQATLTVLDLPHINARGQVSIHSGLAGTLNSWIELPVITA